MKFVIMEDKTHTWNSWALMTNANAVIASSSTIYKTVAEVQQAIKDFRTWVNDAPVEIVSQSPPEKDWRQQALEALKKTPWVKGRA